MSSLGENIRRVRKTARLTLIQLSVTTGISQSHLSTIENGKAYPRIGTLRKIADALDVSPVELMGASDRLYEEALQLLRFGTTHIMQSHEVLTKWQDQVRAFLERV